MSNNTDKPQKNKSYAHVNTSEKLEEKRTKADEIDHSRVEQELENESSFCFVLGYN